MSQGLDSTAGVVKGLVTRLHSRGRGMASAVVMLMMYHAACCAVIENNLQLSTAVIPS